MKCYNNSIKPQWRNPEELLPRREVTSSPSRGKSSWQVGRFTPYQLLWAGGGMVDALASGASERNLVRVQIPLRPQFGTGRARFRAVFSKESGSSTLPSGT